MALTAWEMEVLKNARKKKLQKARRILLYVCIAALVTAIAIVLTALPATDTVDTVTVSETPEEPVNEASVAPARLTLKLTQESIELEKGDPIDYLSYVEEALINGEDHRDQVQYSEISTETTGEFSVVYRLRPENGLVMTRILRVLITEPEMEEAGNEQAAEAKTPKEEGVVQQTAPVQQETTVLPQDPAAQTAPAPQQPVQPVRPTLQPYTKQFLFSAGYDMSNVETACSAEGSASGLSWSCEPLRDGEGIILGMELRTY
ncbi:hypothetical protein [Faecalibaculum rodentium]|jgi:hypothetical protein|uniref:hypothetical protein n=1 Tax=Faecalibaculum rodentium TaxID=1702221 RepID=UPI00248F706F|nr:hypothetical protein [Faecalibaculum rodentium]